MENSKGYCIVYLLSLEKREDWRFAALDLSPSSPVQNEQSRRRISEARTFTPHAAPIYLTPISFPRSGQHIFNKRVWHGRTLGTWTRSVVDKTSSHTPPRQRYLQSQRFYLIKALIPWNSRHRFLSGVKSTMKSSHAVKTTEKLHLEVPTHSLNLTKF